MKNKIVFTGGGSGGHVVPAITLINELRNSWDISYIGGRNGIERSLIGEIDIKYYPIYTGKLRRYFSLENFIDILKVLFGMIQSFFILLKYPRKTIVFSTGGFVSVPVVVAAKLQGKTIYIHEQTSRVGLANKIASKFAQKVFISFEESKKFFPADKTYYTGYPVRKECYNKDIGELKVNGVDLKSKTKPLLFVTGGGNGSKLLNDAIKENIELLKESYFVFHQVGKGYAEEYAAFNDENYLSVPFVGKEMIDLFKQAEIVISRSGAGTVCELLALNKRSIFIPLKIAQKNEQFHNAMEAHHKIQSLVIEEDNFSSKDLVKLLSDFEKDSKTTSSYEFPNAIENILKEL